MGGRVANLNFSVVQMDGLHLRRAIGCSAITWFLA